MSKNNDKYDSIFHIWKLQREINWDQWIEKMKTICVRENVWDYIFESIEESKTLEKKNIDIMNVQARVKYDAALETYETEKKTFDVEHRKNKMILTVTSMLKLKSFIRSIVNSKEIVVKLAQQYKIFILATSNNVLAEMCKTRIKDFASISEYAKHLKSEYNKILLTNNDLSSWVISFIFRIKLKSRLNFYIFQLIHAVKKINTSLSIDEMIEVLANETRRTSYNEERKEKARSAKQKNIRRQEDRNNFAQNNKSSESKAKNRDKDLCDICNSSTHDKHHCYYTHVE